MPVHGVVTIAAAVLSVAIRIRLFIVILLTTTHEIIPLSACG